MCLVLGPSWQKTDELNQVQEVGVEGLESGINSSLMQENLETLDFYSLVMK